MNLNVIYDNSVSSAPAAFKTAISYVANYLASVFTNPVTVNIAVGYGEVDGQALDSGALGESLASSTSYTYSQIRNALASNTAQSATDATALASLPSNDPTGSTWFDVSTAEAKALGLAAGNDSAIDGSVGFSSTALFAYDPNHRAVAGSYDFIGVALHEITEVMGRYAGLSSWSGDTLLDLYRYSGVGVRQLNAGHTAYFSVDGGATNLDNFNTSSGGDVGDWTNNAGNDSFRAFSNSGVVNAVTAADIKVMDAIGWNTVSPSSNGNLAPVAQNDSFIVRSGNTLAIPASAGVLANDTSLSGSPLSAAKTLDTAHGHVVLASDGSFSYTPDAGFVGNDSFQYQVSDAQQIGGKGTVNIVVGSLDALTTPAQQIAELYVGYFDRSPDVTGLTYWLNTFNTVPTSASPNPFYNNIGEIAASFADPHQTETTALYPFLAHPQQSTYSAVVQFVDSAYENLFGRAADSTGEAYWATSIAKGLGIAVPTFNNSTIDGTGPVSASSALLAIINGAQSNDAATVADKVVAGLYYESAIAAHNLTGTTAAAQAGIAAVTADISTVVAAEATTNTYIHNQPTTSLPAEAAIDVVGVSPNLHHPGV